LAGDRDKYLAAGMDEYIAKPLQIGELQAKLELLTTPGLSRLPEADAGESAGEASALAEIVEEIDWLNRMIDNYALDPILFETFVNKIKLLANHSGLEEIKSLAFKSELAAKRDNLEEAMDYANRIRQIIEVYRKTNIVT
jgi:hypothetical protein